MVTKNGVIEIMKFRKYKLAKMPRTMMVDMEFHDRLVTAIENSPRETFFEGEVDRLIAADAYTQNMSSFAFINAPEPTKGLECIF